MNNNLLNIQKFLLESSNIEESFSFLKNDLVVKIKFSPDDKFVMFNYSQIDSPNDNEIVKECRGLILENKTWDLKLFPMKRFFNFGQGCAENIDLSKAVIQEKVDGSMISLWHDGKKWNTATRGTFYGECLCNDFLKDSNITFNELFFKIFDKNLLSPIRSSRLFFDKDLTYTFEICSEYNRVVKLYKEPCLYLISGRNSIENYELDSNDLNDIAKKINVLRPKNHNIVSNSFEELLESVKALPSDDEGYVVFEETYKLFRRIKLKNPQYVLIHHSKSGLSLKNFIKMIMIGESEEFLSYFPSYKKEFEIISESFNNFCEKQNNHYKDICNKNFETRKEIALYIKGLKTEPSFLFSKLDDEFLTPKEYYSIMAEKQTDKIINLLELKDLFKNFKNDEEKI